MGIETETYIRKPLYVEAVRITEENFDAIARWVPGKVQKQGSKRYIKVMVANPKSERQTKAYIGDWILWTEKGGHKVYTPKAFELAFDKLEQKDTAEILAEEVVREPEPGEMTEEDKPITEELEVVAATPQAIANAATEAHETRQQEETAASDSPPSIVNGKRVLSEEDQRRMTHQEVAELLRQGDVVLAQDLSEVH